MGRRTRSPGPIAHGLPSNTRRYGTNWIRLDPTGTSIVRDNGSATKAMDADRVTIADNGAATTITWTADNSESYNQCKQIQKMAVFWADSGYKWGQIGTVGMRLNMSTFPASNTLKPMYGIALGSGTDADDGGWHGGSIVMMDENDTEARFSAKLNITNHAATNPNNVAFTTAKGFALIAEQSASVNRILTIQNAPWRSDTSIFHTSFSSNTAYVSGRVAAPTDPLYVGICVGCNAAVTPPSATIQAIGQFHYYVSLVEEP